ncbi:MAG: type II toxin-antitoxin system Phd/YefM family antitoxin [Candidatus Nanopelagicales bacterium]|jgi:prevent-host-death family protein
MSDRKTVSHRELRNNSAGILRAVAAGESFVVTNHGSAVAVIRPVSVPDYGGLSVQRGDRTRRLRELEPAEGRAGETTQESIDFLRGES